MAKKIQFSVGFGEPRSNRVGFEVHQVEIFTTDGSKLKRSAINDNYQANVKKLGFGLRELWERYEQNTPDESELLKIQKELGAKFYVEDPESAGYGDLTDGKLKRLKKSDDPKALPSNSFYLETNPYYNDLSLPSGDHLKLAMFIVLAGMKKVDWREIEPNFLFGERDSLLRGAEWVGYGLYSY